MDSTKAVLNDLIARTHRAMTETKREIPDGPVIARAGIFDMQVCVPATWSDAQVEAFAEERNPCGTQHGWAIRREGSKYLAGDPERSPCDDRAEFVHVMLEC